MTTSTPTTVVREQNLALRVMRLSNPMLNESICLGRDPADSFSVAICDSVAKLSGQCSVDVPLDPEVYLGETFTLYISIINISAYTCKEIVIKMDIQTQNQRVALGELAFSGIAIEPNQQIGQIFKHDIQELGQHM
uniref:Integrin_alpha2 domain-containing protein n=1 Tax=Globodera pallida TaxID=36090 RepID=A0A183CN64_GLOPA